MSAQREHPNSFCSPQDISDENNCLVGVLVRQCPPPYDVYALGSSCFVRRV